MESVLGIIAPHPPIMVEEVGGSRAGVTARSADAMSVAARALEVFAPDTIVLMSPHAPLVADAFLVDTGSHPSGDLRAFGAARVRVSPPGDPTLAAAILEEARAAGIEAASRDLVPAFEPEVLDHAALVPLSFLDPHGRYPLVELSLSYLPLHAHRAFGEAVRRAAVRVGRRVAFVASGDCSHRLSPDAPAGYSPRAHEFDERLVHLLADGDYLALEAIDPRLIDEAGECGLRSFITLGGFLSGSLVTTRVLSYEAPWGVGYLTAISATPELLDTVLTPQTGAKGGVPGADESEIVALARRAIELYVRHGRMLDTPAASGLLATRHGAFVSLHRGGRLRGCIGTIAPTQPTLAAEVVHNALQAATRDTRFPPVTAEELADLDISVDVLGTPEPAAFEDLDPSLYGVIVSCGWRRGLLLPDLPGVSEPDDQVAIACDKAGIGADERIELERFTVDRYH